jgi:hypothetical protein
VAKGTQSITWSPSTSLTLADSGLSLSATLATGDGNLVYTVEDAGTTGCTVSGSTLSFVSTGSGANGCEVRPTASSTDAYNAKTDASTVTFDVTRGIFAISSPSSKVGTSSSAFTDVCTSSCDISGFAAADEIRVVVSKSDGSALSGRVRLGSTTGLTQSLDGYQIDATSASGFSELGFEGTQAEVNAALETLQYKSPSGGGDETLGVSASLAGAAYFSQTGHYYEVVSTAASFAVAKTLAANKSFNGLTGYLATILSDEENRFIDSKISTSSVWVGGEYVDTNADGTPDSWKWVTGPVADQIVFRDSNGDAPGVFTEWEPGQPDGSGNCMATNYDGDDADSLGNWDDLDCDDGGSPRLRPYVVEYGSNGGSVLKEAATTFTVGAPTAPLQVTGASAAAGNSQVVLSWSAPDSGGSAITDYVVEQFDADTSTWTLLSDEVATTSYTVTGLTNGTSYSFRVSAKNVIGTGTVSATVTATPVTPPEPAPSSGGGSGAGTIPPTPGTGPTSPAIPRILTPPQTIPRPTILQGPVITPVRSFDTTIGTRATIGGAPATVTKRSLPGGGLSVETGAFQFGMNLTNPNGGGAIDTQNPTNTSEFRVPAGQSTTFSGGGLLPGSQLQVWLPGPTGNTPRELARVPVRADGTFDTALSFTLRQSETPVPIGRQVMQVAGFDEEGNQTVVDMVVNIGQGAPAPEPNRSVNALPDLSPGQSLATSAGTPETVTVEATPQTGQVAVLSDDWAFTVAVAEDSGVVEQVDAGATITMVQTKTATVSGEGFQPDTRVDIWLFSDPTLLGSVIVSADGSFTGEVYIDAWYATPGEHTLQLQGVADDGFIKAANLGVVVQEPVEFTTENVSGLLWWVIGAFLLAVVFIVLLLARSRRNA